MVFVFGQHFIVWQQVLFIRNNHLYLFYWQIKYLDDDNKFYFILLIKKLKKSENHNLSYCMKTALLICSHLYMSKNAEGNFLLCNSYTTEMGADSVCFPLLHCLFYIYFNLKFFRKQRWEKLPALLTGKNIHLSM